MPVTESQNPTIARIKTLLRRDLKLDPQSVLADDMPLIGGQLDLDSLDVLLIVTTIEKEFGIKAPADGSAKEIFRTVSTLAAYLEAQTGPETTCVRASIQPDLAHVLNSLPHQPPFRFITRLDELQMGVSGRATWSVTGRETFFAGHFPGRPLVPGVLLAEALAQLSGLVSISGSAEGRLAQVNVKFARSVTPSADITLASRLTQRFETLVNFDVTARVSGQAVAEGSLTLSLGPTNQEGPIH